MMTCCTICCCFRTCREVVRRSLLLPTSSLRRRYCSSSSSNTTTGTTTASSSPYDDTTHDKVPFYGLPRDDDNEKNEWMTKKVSSILRSPWMMPFDRLTTTLQHAVIAFHNPNRADAVAAVGELTGLVALEQLCDVMRNDPIGQQILSDRPIVSKDTIPYERLINSAQGISFHEIIHHHPNDDTITFGQGYGAFLSSHDFDPDERDEIRYLDEDSDVAYVMLRYRQCHDFYHTITGLPPTVLGEIALKWLELYQTNLPLAALSATVGSLRLAPTEQQFLWQHYIPWAQRITRHMPFGTLLNVYYEKEWDTPLIELRRRLSIEPAPTTLAL